MDVVPVDYKCTSIAYALILFVDTVCFGCMSFFVFHRMFNEMCEL